eukprot:16445523-Heterocapsa_arctica.AAC.1
MRTGLETSKRIYRPKQVLRNVVIAHGKRNKVLDPAQLAQRVQNHMMNTYKDTSPTLRSGMILKSTARSKEHPVGRKADPASCH